MRERRRRGLSAQAASSPAAARSMSAPKRDRTRSSTRCSSAAVPNQNASRSCTPSGFSGSFPNQNRRTSSASSMRIFYWRKSLPAICATKSPGAILDSAKRWARGAEAQDGPSNAAIAQDRPRGPGSGPGPLSDLLLMSFAEAFEIPLRHRRQPLQRQRARLRRIHDVLQRARDQHLPDARMPRRCPCHFVEHGEAAVDLVSGGPVLLDGAGQILAEAGVEEIIVVPDLEARLGEKVGKILF